MDKRAPRGAQVQGKTSPATANLGAKPGVTQHVADVILGHFNEVIHGQPTVLNLVQLVGAQKALELCDERAKRPRTYGCQAPKCTLLALSFTLFCPSPSLLLALPPPLPSPPLPLNPPTLPDAAAC